MNKEECINKIFKEVMFSKPDHPLTIVCCFHNRKDMQNFIQLFYDKFKIKINFGIVSDWTVSVHFSTAVLENRIHFMQDNCKCLDGINPDLFYYQEGIYHSQIIEFFKYKSKYVKNSQIYSFK